MTRRFFHRLLLDTSGDFVTNGLSFSPTWLVVFGVFLMNVQLGRNYEQRDMVDHAAALAADAVMKNACDNSAGAPSGTLSGATLDAVDKAVVPLFDLVSSAKNPCRVTARPTDSGLSTSGAREIDVEVTCRFPCTVPFASALMCTDGHVTYTSKQKTVAMGCDAS
jgi:hypothetical protein